MHELRIGEIVTTPHERDAIHVAVIQVMAGEKTLRRGEWVA